MGRECLVGFADLFAMARKREWTPDERRRFEAMGQDARNEAVRELGREAGCIRTEERRGTDGQIYTAFWVEGPPWFEELNDRWSTPVSLADIDPATVPERGGCLILTADRSPMLVPRRVQRVVAVADLRAWVVCRVRRGTSGNHRPLFARWVATGQYEALGESLERFLEPQRPTP
jgi:hypothetical protein